MVQTYTPGGVETGALRKPPPLPIMDIKTATHHGPGTEPSLGTVLAPAHPAVGSTKRRLRAHWQTTKSAVLFWLYAATIVFMCSQTFDNWSNADVAGILHPIYGVLAPLAIVLCFSYLCVRINSRFIFAIVPYVLFFAVSVTSVFGLTESLTGSHAQYTFAVLHGLSFYTASLAYIYITKNAVDASTAVFISNPLLLITGPIATFFARIKHRRLIDRLYYFMPFVILGAFLHQVIATPLTRTFSLIEKTDLVSCLVFALIFELFVYANFCGLSLVIYGICGILGYRIPLNFRQPFSSRDLIAFWRGWHVSLSTVLKALIYTPVRQRSSAQVAIAFVFISSAMWHGVTLNFVLWGLFHASAFILTKILLERNIRFLPTLLFIMAVVIGRLLFLDSDTSRLLEKLSFAYGGFGVFSYVCSFPRSVIAALTLAIMFVVVEFAAKDARLFRQRTYKFYRLPLVQFFLLLVMFLLMADDNGVNYAVYGQR